MKTNEYEVTPEKIKGRTVEEIAVTVSGGRHEIYGWNLSGYLP